VQEAGVEVEEAAGATERGEFRCAECGYGAIVQRALPPCPMCGAMTWESRGPLVQGLVD
jgi:rubrerythrin